MSGSKHQELVRGEVVETMPPGKEHGRIALAIGKLLSLWVEQGAGGEAGVESGFILAHDPDTIRGPDVYYLSAPRILSDDKSVAFWTVAPDIAVEVISPGETANEVQEKINDYLAAGTQLVWTVYPPTRQVVAYTPDGLARTYSGDDVLEYPDVLPGFSCKVSDLFK
jgi:Uma2 family endonuclease